MKKNTRARQAASGPERGEERGVNPQVEASEERPEARKKRARRALELLRKRYPEPSSLLKAENAWQLLVATVLAAQCTDARVNLVTPELFARWPDIPAMAGADQAEVESVIRSTGFYRNKAKNLIAAARRIMEMHGGEVPRTMDELTALPGVARKTANIILWGAFGRNDGLAVDTHVKRITYRLGLTENTDPVQVEKDLLPLFPRESWGDVNHMLVWFGRDVCVSRAPKCGCCEMASFCPQNGVTKKDNQAECSK